MTLTDKLRRPSALAVAALLLLASLVPLLSRQQVGAYGLLASRKITMSSSANGLLTAGQGVSYEVSFNVASDLQDISGVVVDFCSNSPIVGDTCTAPVGFDTALATVTLNAGLTGFTKDTTATTVNKFVLTNTVTPYNPGAAENIRFTLDAVDNPETVNTTFYARILTFTTAAGATGYTSAAPGAEPPLIDAGGVALSTAAQITVTAKVQERLVFCVYTTGAGNDCSAKSGASVLLGDVNGVLDPSGVYVDKNAKYSITTNASGNAVVRAKGATLTSGAFSIDAFGAPNTSTPGIEEFGFCTYQSAGTGMTINTDYDGATGVPAAECSGTTQSAGTGTPGGDNAAEFGFVVANLATTYGADVATKPAGTFSTGTLVFAGNISNTTEAGLYTSVLTFIATGTY